ncbi:MAG: hypothetical protein GY816_15095, partial [Cytophagales bacterium]|nr:hypothetical protein [Cytophagales bacterium]
MKESILESFEKLKGSKKEIMMFLEAQHPKDLEISNEGGWCMIQAMRHIQFAEDSIVTYLSKKMQAGDDLPERTFRDRISLAILFLVFFLRFKFKAPKTARNPLITSLDELEKDWDLTRNRLKSFISQYPDKWYYKAIYRHPAGMRLN